MDPQVLCAEGTTTAPSSRDLSDSQLLACFNARRDEASFAALVRRYAGTVWRVCRGVLRQEQDAEDAFQAVFVLLARKAKSIRKSEAVGSWLYGVAYRIAMGAKRSNSRRREHEQKLAGPMPEQQPQNEAALRELQHLLDEEVQRLGAKYRVPFVLCCLEGLTKVEAARELGWKEGTVSGRVSQARQLLQKRLARRGFTLSAALTAVALTHNLASAAGPPALVHATVQAIAGKAALTLSPEVAALANSLLRTMVVAKFKAAALLLSLIALLGGVALAAQQGTPDEKAPEAKAESKVGSPPRAPQPRPLVMSDDAVMSNLAWTSDGKVVASVGETYETVELKDNGGDSRKVLARSNTMKLWDARTGELNGRLGQEKKTYITALAFSPDGKMASIAVSRPDAKREIRLVDAKTWEVKHRWDEEGLVVAIAFSPDGQRLAFGGSSPVVEHGSFVKLWDVPNAKLIGGTKEKKRDGKEAAEAKGAAMPVGPPTKGAPEPPEKRQATLSQGMVKCLAFSPDGQVLAAGDMDAKIRLFDGQTAEPEGILADHRGMVYGIAFSPDGKTLVSGSRDKTVKFWDIPAGTLRRTQNGNGGWIMAVALSPDGKLLATGSAWQENDKWFVERAVWDAKTGAPQQILTDETMPVYAQAFSPDRSTLAVAVGKGGRPKDGDKTTGEIRLYGPDFGIGTKKTDAKAPKRDYELKPDGRGDKGPSAEKKNVPIPAAEGAPTPKTAYAREVYHSFADPKANHDAFEFTGPDANDCVKYESEGLRITLPIGYPGRRFTTGVAYNLAVKGDFEITVTFEILREPSPSDTGQGTSVGFGIDLNTRFYNRATFSRGMREGPQYFTWFQLSDENTGKPVRDELRPFAATAKTGRLRMVRTGNVLSYYVAEGTSQDFVYLRHHPFSDTDVRTIRIGGGTGGPQASLDSRVVDVRVRADWLPEVGASGGPMSHHRGLWALLIIAVAVCLCGALAVWLFYQKGRFRQKQEEGDPAKATSVIPCHCGNCGRNLKVRAHFVGKKIKCPQCGSPVQVPPL
jgi:RNA polymerase sigma factor (sigma-70 family)